jgi:hypothetical protein
MKTIDTVRPTAPKVRPVMGRIPIRFETRHFTVQPVFTGVPIRNREAMRPTR